MGQAPPSRDFVRTALILLLAAAFVLVSGLISAGIFEAVPHVEDEAAYWFQAQVFAGSALSVPTPPEPDAYWSPFVIDVNGHRFGKYPPGYPLLLSLGMRLGAPWLVNALLGAASLVLLADAGRRLFSPLAGLLAAALGLTCPVLLAHAGSLLSHPTAIFCVTALVWSLAGMETSLNPPLPASGMETRERAHHPFFSLPWAVGAGLALGGLLLTRPYDALGVGLPVAAYWLVQTTRHRSRPYLTAGLVTAGTAVLVALLLPLYWHAVTGLWLVNPYQHVYPYDHPGLGPAVGPQGYTVDMALSYLGYNLLSMAHSFLGWPAYLSLVFVPIPFLFGPRSRRPCLLLAIVAGLVFVYSTYWYYGGHDAGFPRYYTAAIPCLLLLTGRGIDLTAGWLRRRGGRLLPALTLYPLLIGLVAWNAFVFLPPQLLAFRGKYGVTAGPAAAIQAAAAGPTLVFVTGVNIWHDFAPFFAANSPALDSQVVYAIYRDPRQMDRVRALFPDRTCSMWDGEGLADCDENDQGSVPDCWPDVTP